MSETNGISTTKLNLSTSGSLSTRGATQLAELDAIHDAESGSRSQKSNKLTQQTLHSGQLCFSACNFVASLADSLAFISLFSVAILGGPPGGYAASMTIALPMVLTSLLSGWFINWKNAQAWQHISLAIRALSCSILPAVFIVQSQDPLSLQKCAITLLCVLCSVHCVSSSLTMRQWGIPLQSQRSDLILFGPVMAIPLACLIKLNSSIDAATTVKICSVLYVLALWAILEGRRRIEAHASSDGATSTFQLSKMELQNSRGSNQLANVALLAASTLTITSICIVFVPLTLFSAQAISPISVGRTTTFLDLFWYLSFSFVIGCCTSNQFSARRVINKAMPICGIVVAASGLALLGTLGLGEWCRTAFFLVGVGGGIAIYGMEVRLALSPLQPRILSHVFGLRAAIVMIISLSMSAMAESMLPSTSSTYICKSLAMFAIACILSALPAMLVTSKTCASDDNAIG